MISGAPIDSAQRREVGFARSACVCPAIVPWEATATGGGACARAATARPNLHVAHAVVDDREPRAQPELLDDEAHDRRDRDRERDPHPRANEAEHAAERRDEELEHHERVELRREPRRGAVEPRRRRLGARPACVRR